MAAVASRQPINKTSSAFATSSIPSSAALDGPPLHNLDFNITGTAMTSRLRASSDPLSRGGAFTGDGPGILEQEPNPFEQSFSGSHASAGSTQAAPNGTASKEPTVNAVAGTSAVPAPPRRARSNSPPAPRMTPGGIQKLPPLSLLGTPSHELSGFGWNVDSLRTGPLSPALLNGPQHASGLYDQTHLRTGLTPMPSGVSFPPPSPATAALFAMMTNNTPGDPAAAGLAGGGPRPHEGLNEGNPFDASYARATTEVDQKPGSRGTSSDYQPHIQNAPLPLTAAHRSQLTSTMNGRPMQAIAPQHMHPGALAGHYPGARAPYQIDPQQQLHHQPHHQMQPLGPQHQQNKQQQQSPRRAAAQPPFGAQNPLYLLSQAQDLSNHNDDAVVAAAALSNLGGPATYSPVPESINAASINGVMPGAIGGGMSTRGQKMSSPASSGTNGPIAPAPKGKRAASQTNKRKKADEDGAKKPPAKRGRAAKKQVDEDDEDMMMDDDDFYDGGSDKGASQSPRAGNGAGETEEEKRKNFLERNRQAALKCRQRKKAWLANLQSKVELLTADNDTLQSTVTNLKDEVASLRAILAAHSSCPIAINNADRRGSQYAAPGGQRF